VFNLIVIVGLLLPTLLAGTPAPTQAAPGSRRGLPLGLNSADSVKLEQSLQFTAGGHVLGFRPGEMYLAAADHMLKVEFVGAWAVTPISNGASPLSNLQSQISALRSLTYSDLWDGVTLVYEHSAGAVVKSTYRIAPQTSNLQSPASNCIKQIRLRYDVPVRLDAHGNLLLTFQTGQLRESAPVAWQETGGKRVPVTAAFRLLGEREVGFSVGAYDPACPLVIDSALTWSTFLGSASDDRGNAIAVDGAGNVYVAGDSHHAWGSPVNAHAGGYDAFVAKLNSSGGLVWNTFLGSASDDYGTATAVDGSGNVYVAGYSNATWGTNPKNAHAGGVDAFAAKLNSSGVRQWHTFLGSASDDFGKAIAVDGAGNVYVAGYSYATWGSPVNPYAWAADAFAAKLDSSGVRQWHTFLGSANDDYGNAIAMDGSENVYVAGQSNATWGSPVNPYAGDADAFAAKLNGSDGARQWNTFLGGPADYDRGNAIAVDGAGNVYVAGSRCAVAGDSDAFAAKLNSSGFQQGHTFLGSTDYYDYGNAIAADGAGYVYVGGESWATWGTPVNPYVGGLDAFVDKFFITTVYLPVVQKKFFCDQYEPNDRRDTAWGPLAGGQVIYAQICQGDPRDLYYFDASRAVQVTIDLSSVPPDADFGLYLWDQTGVIPLCGSRNGPGQDEKVVCTMPVKGRYYIDVYPWSGTGPYTLQGSGW
jgi:hypothetical protein